MNLGLSIVVTSFSLINFKFKKPESTTRRRNAKAKNTTTIMKLFNKIYFPTLFPNPSNTTETRFYAMNNIILSLAAILPIFLNQESASNPMLNNDILVFETSLIIRFIHLGSLVLLITLGPNASPIGFVARICSVYGFGNKIEPCGAASKVFSQMIATLMVAVSIVGEIFLGPMSIPSLLPTFGLIFASSLDAILGFCIGCWMYKEICNLAGIDSTEEFTSEQLIGMYTGWPMIPGLSNNVIEFRKTLTSSNESTTTEEQKDSDEFVLGNRTYRYNEEDDDDDVENQRGNSVEKNTKEQQPPSTDDVNKKWKTECSGGVCKLVRNAPPKEEAPAPAPAPADQLNKKWKTECSGGVCKLVCKTPLPKEEDTTSADDSV